MGDNKYGRLFTEADVERMLRYAHDRAFTAGMVEEGVGLDLDDARSRPPTLREIEEGEQIPLKFPADEPLFLLRGQDLAAVGTIWYYASEVTRLGASPDFVTAALKASNDMADWQHEQGGRRVKVPD